MTQIVAIVVAVLTVAGMLYVLRRPRWAVLLIMVMFPLEQLLQSYFPFLRTNKMVFNFVVGGLVVFAVLSRVMKRENVFSGVFNGVWIPMVVLYIHAWVATLWSPSHETVISTMLFGVPYVILLLFCAPLLLEDLDDFRRIITGLLIIGTCIATLILLNPNAVYSAGRLTIDYGFHAAHTSRRSNPLALAGMGGMMALVATLIRYDRATMFMSILRAAAFILGLGLAVVSGSRGQVIAVAIVGVAFFPIARSMANPKQFIVTAGMFFVMAGLTYMTFMLFVGDVNRDRWDLLGIVASTGGRYDMVVDLFKVYLSHPAAWMFGLGSNAFTSVTSFGNTPYVHNLIVEVICELGLFGGALLGLMAISVYRYGYDLWNTHRHDIGMRSTAAVLCAMPAYATVLAMKQGSYVAGGAGALLWWYLLARISCHERQVREEAALEDANPRLAGFEEFQDEFGDYSDYGEGDDDEEYSLAH